MGVIERQGLKHTLVNLIGVGIGILSTIFIYPRATELFGLAQMILGSSILMMSVFSLGFNVLAIKFFPRFKNENNGHNGFLRLLLTGVTVGILCFLILLPLARYILLDLLFQNNPRKELFEENFYYIVPVTILLVYNFIFLQYISNFHRIVFPTLLDQLLIKLTLPILVLLYIFKGISLNVFFAGIVINYILVFLGLFFYTKNLGQLKLNSNWSFLDKTLVKEMRSFSFYGLMTALGSQLAFRIDTLMVAGMIGLSSGGVYAIVNVIIDVMRKPSKAILAITAPIISQKWQENEVADIQSIYQKSSILLLISGVFIFLGVWLSLDDLFNLMANSDEIRTGTYVVFYLGLAKLMDLASGVNGNIIGYSNKYRFNFYSLMFLAVINIVMNLFFIPRYQMVGAAMATFCSISIFNLAKIIFVWWQFKIQPFTIKTILLFGIGLACYFIIHSIPLDFIPILNILFRSIALTALFGILVLGMKISPDFQAALKKGLKNFKFLG